MMVRRVREYFQYALTRDRSHTVLLSPVITRGLNELREVTPVTSITSPCAIATSSISFDWKPRAGNAIIESPTGDNGAEDRIFYLNIRHVLRDESVYTDGQLTETVNSAVFIAAFYSK